MGAQNQEEAADDLFTLITQVWQANTPAGTPLYYDNQDEKRPANPALFGRTVLRHFGSSRETVGNAGENSALFRRRGSVYVQIFVPQGSGTSVARAVAEAMIEAFEDADSTLGVRLTNSDINELGSDGTYWQINVVSDFSYDRIS